MAPTSSLSGEPIQQLDQQFEVVEKLIHQSSLEELLQQHELGRFMDRFAR